MSHRRFDQLVTDMIDHPGVAIVDDNIDLTYLLKKLLDQKHMYVSFVAYNGDDAVKKFIECSSKPDIIIMDYRLPDKNGIETMKEILCISRETQIIFLSADSEIEKESLQSGAAVFLKKPARMNKAPTMIAAEMTISPFKV